MGRMWFCELCSVVFGFVCDGGVWNLCCSRVFGMLDFGELQSGVQEVAVFDRGLVFWVCWLRKDYVQWDI